MLNKTAVFAKILDGSIRQMLISILNDILTTLPGCSQLRLRRYIIIENEITTTTTVIHNQIIGTITTLLVKYILLTLIVFVNIINVSK